MHNGHDAHYLYALLRSAIVAALHQPSTLLVIHIMTNPGMKSPSKLIKVFYRERHPHTVLIEPPGWHRSRLNTEKTVPAKDHALARRWRCGAKARWHATTRRHREGGYRLAHLDPQCFCIAGRFCVPCSCAAAGGWSGDGSGARDRIPLMEI